jgi:mycothiol synthase
VSIEVREPREDEAAEIAELLNEHARAAFGEVEIGAAEVRHWFTLPDIWIRVAEREGGLVGYLDAVRRGGGEAVEFDIRSLDRDVAQALLAAGERYAQPGLARAVAQGDDQVLAGALGEAGWRPIRQSYQMRIELTDDLPEPRWPEGITVRTFHPGEEERVYRANNAAFADHWDFHTQPFEAWRAYGIERADFDPSLWWLAEDGDELAALCLDAWHISGDPEFGWVAVLGVRPEWRRQGLGTALLHHSFRDFRSRGATRVGLGVDAENTTGAVRLYERAGMHVTRRNETYERQLS